MAEEVGAIDADGTVTLNENAGEHDEQALERLQEKRVKNWDELTVEEKLNRARQIIKSLEEEVRMLKAGHEKLSWQFKKHGHDANGVVTLPLEQAEQMLYSGIIPGRYMNGGLSTNPDGTENKYF